MGCCTEGHEKDGFKFEPPNAPPEVKKHLGRYYDKCRERYGDKEYCSRVAWQIYCKYKNPGYAGCTAFGRESGPPYSAPLSRKGNVARLAALLVQEGHIDTALKLMKESEVPAEIPEDK